mmetsp:Transcript_39333/g.117667  ORF Transcript_39333/g.117667 Transcript_39333/m.117667 type:complete len:211 (-) Transcript_39333:2181-2813(-)
MRAGQGMPRLKLAPAGCTSRQGRRRKSEFAVGMLPCGCAGSLRGPEPLDELGVGHDPLHGLADGLVNRAVDLLALPEGLDLGSLLGGDEAGARDPNDAGEEHRGGLAEARLDLVVVLLYPLEDRLSTLPAGRSHRHRDVDEVLGSNALAHGPLQGPLLERRRGGIAQCAVDVDPHSPIRYCLMRGHDLVEQGLRTLALHGDAQDGRPDVR